jgi:hypothetical protein
MHLEHTATRLYWKLKFQIAQATLANISLSGATGNTQLTFGLTAGQTYYIRFSGALTADDSLSSYAPTRPHTELARPDSA